MVLVKRFQVVRDNVINPWLIEVQELGGTIVDVKYTGDSVLVIYNDGVPVVRKYN